MAMCRNNPGELTKYPANKEACRRKLPGFRRHKGGIISGQNYFAATARRSNVSSSPKNRLIFALVPKPPPGKLCFFTGLARSFPLQFNEWSPWSSWGPDFGSGGEAYARKNGACCRCHRLCGRAAGAPAPGRGVPGQGPGTVPRQIAQPPLGQPPPH